MKKLLIVTDLSFPKGSAMASRILSFCHLFNDIGYDVHVVTGKLEDQDVVCGKTIQEDFYSYEVVYSNRSYRLQSYFGNENLADVVDEYLSNNNVDLVFMTSLNANFVKVFNVCKKHDKKVILEQCEWYDPSSFTFGKFDSRYVRFIHNIEKEYIKADGIISISRLLNDYYLSENCKSIRIPSILDVENKPISNKTKNSKIKLVYTGNASKSKELLKPILEALNRKQEYQEIFELNIYGINKKQLLSKIDNDESILNKNIFVNGFISQDKIEQILLDSDYQIFIRPNRRSSNAGFPTKLAESMAVGTPVVTNDTGDICLYLKDGVNGYVCNGTTKEDIVFVFDKILKDNASSLRENARKTAEESFNYKKYTKQVEELINTL